VRINPHNNLSVARLGIIAAKKALPRAVDRNRGKRLVREIFREVFPSLAAVDVVVQLRSAVAKLDNATARKDLIGLFGRIDKDPDKKHAARPDLAA